MYFKGTSDKTRRYDSNVNCTACEGVFPLSPLMEMVTGDNEINFKLFYFIKVPLSPLESL